MKKKKPIKIEPGMIVYYRTNETEKKNEVKEPSKNWWLYDLFFVWPYK